MTARRRGAFARRLRSATVWAAWAVACAAASAHAPPSAASAATLTDPRAADPAVAADRLAVLQAAEAALARGDTAAAQATFDRAALMLHAPDTEMGLVRTYMQAGQYRRALAFGAHAAGAHLEAPVGSALYAWLLAVGAQQAYALRLLDDTAPRAAGDAAFAAAQAALQAPAPRATGVLLETPHRMAPQPLMASGQPAPPAAASVVATGVLLDGGARALAPLQAAHGTPLWVRDGLGHTAEARVERSLPDLGLVLLRLPVPLPQTVAGAPPLSLAPRDPFGGSPGFVVDHVAGAGNDPQWPWLHAGFFGSVPAQAGAARRLGIAMGPSAVGAVVFDAEGRWAGFALPAAGELPARWLTPAVLRAAAILSADDAAASALAAATPRLGADEIYERSLPLTLQVLAAP